MYGCTIIIVRNRETFITRYIGIAERHIYIYFVCALQSHVERVGHNMNQQFIDDLKVRAKAGHKRVVFAEADCADILRCAEQLLAEDIADVLLVGNPDEVKALAASESINIEGAEFFDYTSEEERQSLVEPVLAASSQFKEKAILRRAKKPLNAAMFLTLIGRADCCAAGRVLTTGDVIIAAQTIIGLAPGVSSISSIGIVDAPGFEGPQGPMLAIGDCAINVLPDAETLADIAIASADTVSNLLGWDPRVAMLAFSTDGSAEDPSIDVIREGVRIAQERRPDLKIDGEFQLDTAINPVSASRKLTRPSEVAGKANVLIFPNLHAGNIGVKLIQTFGHADAYGPIIQGFAKPISDFSRSAPVSEMMGNILMLLVRAN